MMECLMNDFGLGDECCFGKGDSSEYEVIWVL
jgi:hypothetical protein